MAGGLSVRVVMLAVGLPLAPAVAAQGMTDPTRPPVELLGAGPAAPESPLQSVLISGQRKSAIINGQIVPLGGKYGDARLVRITPTEVTLKTDEATEVLKLYPSVDKMPVRPTNGMSSRGSGAAEAGK